MKTLRKSERGGKMKSPCMNCDNRHEKCHVTCNIYLHYQKKVAEVKAESQRETAYLKDLEENMKSGVKLHQTACTRYDYMG